MSDPKYLAGKVALVTGGARGLERGYALRLARLGADVAIGDRNLKGAEVYEFERAQLTAPPSWPSARRWACARSGWKST